MSGGYFGNSKIIREPMSDLCLAKSILQSIRPLKMKGYPHITSYANIYFVDLYQRAPGFTATGRLAVPESCWIAFYVLLCQ